MAGSGIELATAYVRLLPSLQGAQRSIQSQLSKVDLTGSGKTMGGSMVKGLSGALSGVKSYAADMASASGAAERLKASVSPLTSRLSALKGGLSGVASSAKGYATEITKVSGVHAKAEVAMRAFGSAASATSPHLKNAAGSVAGLVSGSMDRLPGVASACTSAIGGMASALAGVAAGAGAAAAGIGLVTKGAVDSYASYEQLVGGVDTLFKESSAQVQAYAAEAYKNAGISANTYMEQATSFSATLLQGLGGDTAKAAEYANLAIVDMSDNANKMGTAIESIQWAYQGFAKQNYTMLDNLKLGYGGTQAEMARLINDSGVLGDTMEVTAKTVNEVSFDKIIEAIHTVQTNLGITGTTAFEAATTIEGSVNSAKAAWSNWLTSIAKDNADLRLSTQQLVESVGVAAQNVVPRVQLVLQNIAAMIQQYVPQVTQWLAESLPQVLATVTQLLYDILTAVAATLPQLVTTLTDFLPTLVESLSTLLTGMLEAFQAQWPSIVESIALALPQIVESAVSFFTSAIPTLVEMGVQLFVALVEAMPSIVDTICAALPQIVDSCVNTFTANIDKIVGAGLRLLSALVQNLPGIINAVVSKLPQIVSSCVSTLIGHLPEFANVGFQLLCGLGEGIANAAKHVAEMAFAAVGSIIDGVKSFLGINSPSKVFAEIGGYTMAGMAVGIEDGTAAAVRQMREAAKEVTGAADVRASVGISTGQARAFECGDTYNISFRDKDLDGDPELREALRTVARAARRRRDQGAYVYGY